MNIRTINCEKPRDRGLFINFPFELYKNDANYVPAMREEMELVMNRKKHPFYKHSDAEFFIAEDKGKIVGRVAVLKNENYCEHHQQQIGFFYYLEGIEDIQVFRNLFSAAFDWFKRHDVKLILGPKGFLRSNAVGTLVEGFEYMPALGMIYNPRYYDHFLTDVGFTKETDHLSGYIDRSAVFPERLHEIIEKVKTRHNFWIKTFASKKEMLEWIPKVEYVHQQSFQHNLGFYPSTPEEFDLQARNFISVVDPKYVRVIMSGEEIAGFMLAFPDISLAIQKCKGSLWPLGWLHILREMKRTPVLDMNGIGILPNYQGLGSNALLYGELDSTLRKSRFQRLEIMQVDERNFRSHSDMQTMGTKWHKRHRTYRMEL